MAMLVTWAGRHLLFVLIDGRRGVEGLDGREADRIGMEVGAKFAVRCFNVCIIIREGFLLDSLGERPRDLMSGAVWSFLVLAMEAVKGISKGCITSLITGGGG